MQKRNVPAIPSDPDQSKGVVDPDSPWSRGQEKSQESMAGQLPHRNQDELIEGNDSDFPEPGLSPEHSGEHK